MKVAVAPTAGDHPKTGTAALSSIEGKSRSRTLEPRRRRSGREVDISLYQNTNSSKSPEATLTWLAMSGSC